MNPVYDFSAEDHATMLGDQIRLEAYHRAIRNQVKPGMVVAEVGTGTGILSAYAASETRAPVFAIEFFEHTAKIARAMMKAAGFDHVTVLQGESYGIKLDPEPEILITETIGALGPEENIVEICYDIKKRHPKVKSFIPANLKIFAEPVQSKQILGFEQSFYDYYACASFGTFDYQAIRPELSKIWNSYIRFASLSGTETVGKAHELVRYDLGKTEKSAFETRCDFSEVKAFDAVHLYFETELDQEVLLSTHYSEPETHWRHAYVSRPAGMNQLVVSYQNPSPSLEIRWEA